MGRLRAGAFCWRASSGLYDRFVKRLGQVLGAGAILLPAPAGAANVPAPIVKPNYPVAPTARDGRHDFDFEFGTWRTHYRLLKHRLAGDHEWYDCYGTSVVRPFWGGSGNLEDGDLKCPDRHVGGMTLRTYDARTRQWTLWWGTRALGVSPPAQLGHFSARGVGDFYSYDSWQGKPIVTRFQWTRVNGNPRFEQAFSTDRGKTWETNWTTDYGGGGGGERGGGGGYGCVGGGESVLTNWVGVGGGGVWRVGGMGVEGGFLGRGKRRVAFRGRSPRQRETLTTDYSRLSASTSPFPNS